MIHSRRQLLTGLVLACSLRRAEAQERMRRVAVLNGVIQHDEGEALVALFRETLAKHGWRVGRNLAFEVRWSTASAESTRTAAEELLVGNPMLSWRGTAAQQIGVEASAAMARSEVEIDNLIAEIGRSGGGLCVMADPFTSKYVSRIVEAVARER